LPPLPLPQDAPTCKPTLATPAEPPRLLSTLPRNAIIKLIHHEGTHPLIYLPFVRATQSTHRTRRPIGHRKSFIGLWAVTNFWNYKYLLQVSRDGVWMDGREFPACLGSHATILKSNSGGPIDRRKYKYLDAVHMDIAFGDCLSVGGFRYALILVDHATQYNWAFGLKNLSLDAILDAIWLFCAVAGSLAQFFYCDCDLKLFGTAISEYLIDNDSKVVAAPAKHLLSNGLVESHWKIMVHMGCTYLTEKQMPRTFWFYPIVHSTRMMNAIQGYLFRSPSFTFSPCQWCWP
jgi:hypothetical protein